jgi:hypothetical protein
MFIHILNQVLYSLVLLLRTYHYFYGSLPQSNYNGFVKVTAHAFLVTMVIITPALQALDFIIQAS